MSQPCCQSRDILSFHGLCSPRRSSYSRSSDHTQARTPGANRITEAEAHVKRPQTYEASSVETVRETSRGEFHPPHVTSDTQPITCPRAHDSADSPPSDRSHGLCARISSTVAEAMIRRRGVSLRLSENRSRRPALLPAHYPKAVHILQDRFIRPLWGF